MDREGWQTTVHGVTKSQTQLSHGAQALEALVWGQPTLPAY